MRIAYVCADPGIPVFGAKGASVHVQEVLRALRRQGARVELFACRFGGDAPADLQDLTCHALPRPPKGDSDRRERAALGGNAALARALTAAGPFDALYERYALWSHAGLDHAARCGIPGLLEVNAPLIQEQAAHRELVNVELAEAVARRAFARASQVLAVSQPVADYVAGVTGRRERIQVVPNGVDTQRFAPTAEQSPGDDFTVGFLGTLKPWHGLALLIDAFAALHDAAPRARLLIIGDGPERDNLAARIAERGLTRHVDFTGAVVPSDVPGWLARLDAAVAPYPASPDSYFSPLKLFEYFAAGLAVVASRVGQLPTLIDHEHTGLMYSPGDTAGLTEQLLRLYRDPALRLRLGQAARQRAETEHTWDAVARRILALIDTSRGDDS